MSTDNLPPLPAPTQGLGQHRWAYSADDVRAYGDARAAAAVAAAVPPGWKVVPVEPTDAMIDRGRKWCVFPRKTWPAMLAAAPEVPR